jgi:hypothetical protein
MVNGIPAGHALVYGSPPLVTVDAGQEFSINTWKARTVVETRVSRETDDVTRVGVYALVYGYFVRRVEFRLGRFLTWKQETSEIKSVEPATYQGDALDLFESAWQDTLRWMTDSLRQWGVKV